MSAALILCAGSGCSVSCDKDGAKIPETVQTNTNVSEIKGSEENVSDGGTSGQEPEKASGEGSGDKTGDVSGEMSSAENSKNA